MAPSGGVAERAGAIHRRHGPRVRDVVAIAFGIAMTLLSAKTPWSSMAWPVILAVGTAGSLALWWRRRWPFATALAGAAVLPLSGNPVPLMVGLFTLASGREYQGDRRDQRDRRRSDGVLAIATSVAAVGLALPEMVDLGRFDLRALVAGAAWAVLFAVAGFYFGARRVLLASLQERAERAEAEADRRDEQARAGERARIAREMHDVLAHKVSLIALHAGALEVNPAADRARVEEVAGVIRTTARQTLEELRTVLGLLRADGGADLVPTPQLPDIRRLVDASCEAGIPAELLCDLTDPDPDLALPDVTTRAVYRVVQEGLTNVHKHAPGAPTLVTLSGDRHRGVMVAVVNRRPAATGPVLPGAGAGLVGLRERMRLVGGTLRSAPEPPPGGGWRLEAWLPWPDGDGDGYGADGVSEAAASRTEPSPT